MHLILSLVPALSSHFQQTRARESIPKIIVMSERKASSHAGEEIVVPRQLFKNELGQENLTVIFACLEERKPFPEHLQISVIPGIPDGVKLTPPPYEFPGAKRREGHEIILTAPVHHTSTTLSHSFFPL